MDVCAGRRQIDWAGGGRAARWGSRSGGVSCFVWGHRLCGHNGQRRRCLPREGAGRWASGNTAQWGTRAARAPAAKAWPPWCGSSSASVAAVAPGWWSSGGAARLPAQSAARKAAGGACWPFPPPKRQAKREGRDSIQTPPSISPMHLGPPCRHACVHHPPRSAAIRIPPWSGSLAIAHHSRHVPPLSPPLANHPAVKRRNNAAACSSPQSKPSRSRLERR